MVCLQEIKRGDHRTIDAISRYLLLELIDLSAAIPLETKLKRIEDNVDKKVSLE